MTKIEWTDRTWNPVTGCTKVSPGCDHCYAETFAERWRGTPGHHFQTGFDITLRPERIKLPLSWNKPSRVFLDSMFDPFHEDIPDNYLAQIFAVMALTPQHTYQVLTKRHARMRALLNRRDFAVAVRTEMYVLDRDTTLSVDEVWPLPNLWLGVSVETQQWADIRVPMLLETPAAVRFLSCEPLLGLVDLGRWLRPVPGCGHVASEDGTCGHPDAFTPECHRWADCPARQKPDDWHGLDWVIVGGESGPRARPLHPDWARQIRDACDIAGVPFFFKQWGAWAPSGAVVIRSRPEPRSLLVGDPVDEAGHREEIRRVGKRAAGRELDGRIHDAFPGGAR